MLNLGGRASTAAASQTRARIGAGASLAGAAAAGLNQRTETAAAAAVDAQQGLMNRVNADGRVQAGLAAAGSVSAGQAAANARASAEIALRTQLARIDQMRDQAIDSGNELLLDRADRLEAEVQARYRAALAAYAATSGQTQSALQSRSEMNSETAVNGSASGQASLGGNTQAGMRFRSNTETDADTRSSGFYRFSGGSQGTTDARLISSPRVDSNSNLLFRSQLESEFYGPQVEARSAGSAEAQTQSTLSSGQSSEQNRSAANRPQGSR